MYFYNKIDIYEKISLSKICNFCKRYKESGETDPFYGKCKKFNIGSYYDNTCLHWYRDNEAVKNHIKRFRENKKINELKKKIGYGKVEK